MYLKNNNSLCKQLNSNLYKKNLIKRKTDPNFLSPMTIYRKKNITLDKLKILTLRKRKLLSLRLFLSFFPKCVNII